MASAILLQTDKGDIKLRFLPDAGEFLMRLHET